MVKVFLIIRFTAILLIGSIVQAKEIPFTPLESPGFYEGVGTIRNQFLVQGGVKAPAFLTGFTQEDRDRLIRLEVTLKEFKESVDKRFEQVDKRFGEMITFFWMIVGIFTAITVSTISFALWDRRTLIRPFEIMSRTAVSAVV